MRKRYNFLVFITLFFNVLSCVKDVDFNQSERIVITPIIESNLVFTNIEANQFSVNGSEITTVTDTVDNIEIFEDEFVMDNLVKTEFFFEVTNSIGRSFNLQIDFLDSTATLQHQISFDIIPSLSGNDVITQYTETFEGATQEALKTTSIIVMTFRLLPSSDGSIITNDTLGRLKLRSKGTFYLIIDSST